MKRIVANTYLAIEISKELHSLIQTVKKNIIEAKRSQVQFDETQSSFLANSSQFFNES